MTTRGIRGKGGSKDVNAWLRKLTKVDGIEITQGARNPHWQVRYRGRVIATVGTSVTRGGFRAAQGDVARALRQEGVRI